MGYTTPNIDRIAEEGIPFTDHQAQPSCTAGRAAFITGQYPIHSGMTKIGQPGSPLGPQAASPTLAEQLKQESYRTGHFDKTHSASATNICESWTASTISSGISTNVTRRKRPNSATIRGSARRPRAPALTSRSGCVEIAV